MNERRISGAPRRGDQRLLRVAINNREAERRFPTRITVSRGFTRNFPASASIIRESRGGTRGRNWPGSRPGPFEIPLGTLALNSDNLSFEVCASSGEVGTIISRELIQVFSEAVRGLINSTLSLSLSRSLARSRNATRAHET